jgi:YVTN family beta-propeller protein
MNSKSFLRVDPAMRRLYVSHATRVDVLDADTGAVLGNIAPMKGIHGIAIVPELRRGFITSGGDRTVVVFDVDSLKILKVIGGLGMKPDAIEYDPDTKMIYVANGQSGGVTVIDPVKAAISANVPIEGKLEGMAFDGKGRLFVNTEDKSEIQVIDTHTLKALEAWSIAPVEGTTGFSLRGATTSWRSSTATAAPWSPPPRSARIRTGTPSTPRQVSYTRPTWKGR